MGLSPQESSTLAVSLSPEPSGAYAGLLPQIQGLDPYQGMPVSVTRFF